ncbi:MAG: thioredoxin domain-containing protein [Anaerolineae bacterium]|nr:MAG: thioredoxin domain-containing protein [Anaerolineae bacterium]
MANYLVNETSPYLLQHADNPVSWYPWGDEPIKKAKEEDKPILLSIGYAACHWCHVMAHESFEDQETAQIMNEYYVNIKVDREERPDLDSIYMDAVVAMTGRGGWPMTVIMTPSGEPFFAGTYFPKSPGLGLPSFKQVLMSVSEAWRSRRREVVDSAKEITTHIARTINIAQSNDKLNDEMLAEADSGISREFDETDGGFGPAPKFPQAMTIEYLLRRYIITGRPELLQMAEESLERMASGGIYDHIGGGFARYSTDSRWLVPHFEKMLYDNALLSRVYLHAWQITGKDIYRRVVEETLDWVLREMRHNDGGFYSSLDADSEGEEGKFYVWNPGQIREILGDEAELFSQYYDISEGGNWEGKSILNVPRTISEVARNSGLDEADLLDKLKDNRRKVLASRSRRVWPGLDDKILTSWNGLMLASLAEAGRDLHRADYLSAAVKNAEFIFKYMRHEDGRLWRTWKEGSRGKYNAYLEDYTFLADGLIALYQSTFDSRWYFWTEELIDRVRDHFQDRKSGGFFDTSDDHESLIFRPKSLQDNAVPSGNSMATSILLKYGLLSGNPAHLSAAETALAGMRRPMAEQPTAFANWLGSTLFYLADAREIAIVGETTREDTQRLLTEVFDGYNPFLVVAAGVSENGNPVPLLANRKMVDGKASAYVCRRFVCNQPVNDPQELRAQLAG